MKVLVRNMSGNPATDKWDMELAAVPRKGDTIEAPGDRVFDVYRVIWFDLDDPANWSQHAACLMVEE